MAVINTVEEKEDKEEDEDDKLVFLDIYKRKMECSPQKL